MSSIDAFIQRYSYTQQCPTLEAFVQAQKDSGQWAWNLENMRQLFGSERNLSLLEARQGFYKNFIQKNIPFIATSHPNFSGELTKEIAQNISQLRSDARSYVRGRSSKLVESFLEYFEPRDKSFDFYWEKYGKNPAKIIDGAMRSNSQYDNPGLLQSTDKVLSFFERLNPYSSSSSCKQPGWVDKSLLGAATALTSTYLFSKGIANYKNAKTSFGKIGGVALSSLGATVLAAGVYLTYKV